MNGFGAPRRPPLHRFFLRAEQLATTAFLTIPYVGPPIAEFFNQVIVPFCTPKRDRVLFLVFGCFKSLEGGLHVLLMRFLPLPSDAGDEPPPAPR
jgi:hypothetical protein